LDAVEKNKYGWFWQCPQGAGCIYRHALPPGFVLKKVIILLFLAVSFTPNNFHFILCILILLGQEKGG